MKIMYYYKTTLRLGGNTINEVVKVVSAPEFLVLGFIHGNDSLVNAKEIKVESIGIAEEKMRLKNLYDTALGKSEFSVDKIFGALGVLPQRLPEDTLELYGIEKMVSNANLADHKLPSTEEELQNENSFVATEEVDVADLMG